MLKGFGGEDVIHHGRSLIVAPGGVTLAGPLEDREGVVTAEIDLDRVIAEKHSLDVTGHYARPDIFQLAVEDEPRLPYG
jgi:nitrilase